jgi:hypothetical protein
MPARLVAYACYGRLAVQDVPVCTPQCAENPASFARHGQFLSAIGGKEMELSLQNHQVRFGSLQRAGCCLFVPCQISGWVYTDVKPAYVVLWWFKGTIPKSSASYSFPCRRKSQMIHFNHPKNNSAALLEQSSTLLEAQTRIYATEGNHRQPAVINQGLQLRHLS